MKILVLDQGNTTLSATFFKDNECEPYLREFKSTSRFGFDYEETAKELFSLISTEIKSIDACAYSCSSPNLKDKLSSVISSYFKGKVIEVSPQLKADIVCNAIVKKEIGPDLLATAQGAYTKYGGNILAVCFGTATTFSYIDEGANFKGTVISPGLGLQLQSFRRRLPHIPLIPFGVPEKILGGDTESALSSGIFWAHIIMTEGIIKEIERELNTKFKVTVCGGHLSILDKHLNPSYFREPDLTAYGIKILCEKNI